MKNDKEQGLLMQNSHKMQPTYLLQETIDKTISNI